MENNKQELLEELLTIETLVRENPCRMRDGLIGAIKEVFHSFVGKYCIESASKDQVAIYFNRNVRTITRWMQTYPDFPKPRHEGHHEVSYNWVEVVQWKLKHHDLFNEKEQP